MAGLLRGDMFLGSSDNDVITARRDPDGVWVGVLARP